MKPNHMVTYMKVHRKKETTLLFGRATLPGIEPAYNGTGTHTTTQDRIQQHRIAYQHHVLTDHFERVFTTSMGAVGVLLLLFLPACEGSIITSPHTVKVYVGESAELHWTVSGSFLSGAGFFIVRRGWYNPSGEVIVRKDIGGNCANNGVDRRQCVYDTSSSQTVIGFRVSDVRDEDASRYSIEINYNGFGVPDDDDSQSELFIIRIITSPHTVKVHVGESAEFRWTVSGSFDYGGFFGVRRGWYSPSGELIVQQTVGGSCATNGVDRRQCVYDTSSSQTVIGFRVSDVRDEDASRYSIEINYNGFGIRDDDDSGAVLYIFKSPASPDISGDLTVRDGSTTSLTCTASSRSLPADFRHNVSVIEYTWSSSVPTDPGTGSSVTVGPVSREDNGATVTCTSRDKGSAHGSSEDVNLNVEFEPTLISKPQTTYQSSDNATFSYVVRVMANPFPNLDMIKWSFQSAETLPENVVTSVLDTADPHTKDIVLYILSVQDIHYGTYQLTVQNSQGQERVQFDLKQIGPPLPGSAPVLVKSTAVSLHITWTAGYNGGLDQTQDVMHQLEGSTVVHMSRVDSPVNVSTGDVVYHKVTEALEAESTYKVWVRSSNSFSRQSSEHGPSSVFSTTAKAVFVSEPVIELDNSKANIKLHIRGPLTHVLVENCVTG